MNGLNKYLEKLDARLEKQAEALHSIDKTLAKQEENLKDYMRRTELAEENINLLRKEVEPIKSHVVRVDGILWSSWMDFWC